MNPLKNLTSLKFITYVLTTSLVLSFTPSALSAKPKEATKPNGKKPNIVVIMGDDVGMWNIGAYHRGLMAGRTPNIDKLASQGAIFTDYYAEASCTAGRSAFITGELPIRTGMTTVGQAGADIGLPKEALTLATALKSQGYMTAQFGKNHLGDKNKFLPCVHGFDEFLGYLYHLNAMEDPFNLNYPPDLRNKVGPRNVIQCWAINKDDTTVDPRWGKVGKQKIVDRGPLPPHPMKDIEYNMETFDDVILDHSLAFIDKAHKDDKPFFLWVNPTRMHVFTHLSKKYKDMQTPENNWSIQEAGMAQFDDVIGSIMKKLEELSIADNTIILVTTDNGAETFTWPDGGISPFAGDKGSAKEGGFRAPAIIRWPGKIKPNQVINGVISGLDWFPTFMAAANKPDIKEELLKGKELEGQKYKVHLDGYNQLDMLTKSENSKRDEIWYFTQSELAAVRLGDFKYVLIDQPQGWLGGSVKLNFPQLYNLRLDPFERASFPVDSWMSFREFYAKEFWRFIFLQQKVEELAKTAVEYPPMQEGASFNLDSVKSKIKKMQAGYAQ